MTGDPLRVLVIGTGVVGQLYGGLLHRAGHRVTFLTREGAMSRFADKPIRLLPKKGAPIHIDDGDFILQAESFAPYDVVFACVRGDQREALAALLAAGHAETVRLVLCFPLWSHQAEWFIDHTQRCHYLFPGIQGVFRGDDVEFKNGLTQLCPLGETPRSETEALAAALTEAGLPAKVRPRLFQRFQTIMALGFPFLLALAAGRGSYAEAVRDRGRMRHVCGAMRECIAMLRAGGVATGVMGPIPFCMPPGLMAFGIGMSRFVVRGFMRDMFDIHFKKVQGQTYTALKELREWEAARTVSHPHLDALLEEAEKAGVI